MKKVILGMIGLSLLGGAAVTMASPEQDRLDTIKYFQTKYPNVKIEDYVYGSLAFDQDTMDQYNAIMEFPPFESEVEKGKKMWDTPFKNGKTYASCMPNGGKNIAGNYPYFDDKAGKVVTFQDALNACRVANGEQAYNNGDMKTMGLLQAYARTLSDGMLSNVKVEGAGALAAYDDGKKTFYSRKGQLNFACATCHVQNAGTRLRSELISPVIGHTVHWPVFRAGDNLFTIHRRYVGCVKSVRGISPKEGDVSWNNLEYFHSYMSNGLPLKASVFRK